MAPDLRPHRVVAFDGLRACAALSVVAYHVAESSALTRYGPLAPALSMLKGGVAIFFVISGFLLYLPYARALGSGTGPPNWRAYAQRRALRIVPAYWVVLTVVAAGPLSATVLSSDWWRYYGLAQIYDDTTISGGLPVAWSLCVEVTFYVALPLLALLAARIGSSAGARGTYRRQMLLIGILALGSIALRVALAGSVTGQIPRPGLLTANSLLGFLDWFAWGMGLAVVVGAWESGWRGFAALRGFLGVPWGCWTLALVLFLYAAWMAPSDLYLPLYGAVPHLLIGLAGLLIVAPAAVAGSDRHLLRVLASPIAVWLGTISYGIYLWHVPIIEAINGSITVPPSRLPLPAAAALLVAALVGGIVLGALSWYLVERPATRLVRRRRAPEPGLTPAQAVGTP
jgi:peptidoglycan/LPS O-acetylase OafA/YrhL